MEGERREISLIDYVSASWRRRSPERVVNRDRADYISASRRKQIVNDLLTK
jgi:hypothetical protein